MKSFIVLSCLASVCLSAPHLAVVQPYINSGAAAGPLTAAFGDLVSTSRGLRPISLEGFSEDVNQDGFVDPVAQAAPVVAAAPVIPHIAPVIAHAAPAVSVNAVELPKVEVKTIEAPKVVAAAAPLIHHAPVVQYSVPAVTHTVHHIPQVHVQRQVLTHTTHHVINHAPVVSGLVPQTLAVAPVEEAAVEAA